MKQAIILSIIAIMLGGFHAPVGARWINNGPDIVWTDGEVGIGTPNPITSLHIVDELGGGFGGFLLQSSTAPSPGLQKLVLRLHHQGPNLPSGGEAWSFEMPGNEPGRNGDLELRQVNASFSLPRLVLKTNGDIGVGTQDPAARFHVAGAGRLDGDLTVLGDLTGGQAGGMVRIETNFGTTDIGMRDSIYSHFRTSATRFFFQRPVWLNSALSSHIERDLVLQTEGNTRMFIRRADGHVGIGTTNPQSLLAVNGKITAKEVEVTTAGWADHVFERDYALLPLEKVAEHIEAEGRLPGIPSEREVMAEGVELGAMQVKLLEKIEELTLHMIALKQTNDALEARLGLLETTGGEG